MLTMENQIASEEVWARNERILTLTADYLRRSPGWISKEMVDEIEYMFSRQNELNNKAFYSIRKATVNELNKIERVK